MEHSATSSIIDACHRVNFDLILKLYQHIRHLERYRIHVKTVRSRLRARSIYVSIVVTVRVIRLELVPLSVMVYA
jgi:hypothetical protein